MEMINISKKVTATDVAELAGVSQTTVSFVLSGNGKKKVSEKTIEKVMNAAKELNYVPAKKSAPSEQLINIAVVVPNLSNIYYPFLLQSLESFTHARGINIVILDTMRSREIERNVNNFITTMNISGVLYLMVPQEKLPVSIPRVILSESTGTEDTDIIKFNSFKAGYILAEHMISLGHKNIAYITTPLNNITSSRIRRLDGIKQCMKDHGIVDRLSVFESTCELEAVDTTYEYEVGKNLTLKLLEEAPDTTAIIAVNDMTAIGCISILREKGISIPERMAVGGFDNLLISSMIDPPLTSVDQMARQSCQIAIDLLLEKINRTHSPNAVPMVLECSPNLIVRRSTKG
ncbi:MAG: LacI family DNA-binding transcriptional regulator [Candidatus Limivicinus sp.]|jgi:LacI family transcriptional regulator